MLKYVGLDPDDNLYTGRDSGDYICPLMSIWYALIATKDKDLPIIDETEEAMCRGGDCMFWRWPGYIDKEKNMYAGYCGLAGMPRKPEGICTDNE